MPVTLSEFVAHQELQTLGSSLPHPWELSSTSLPPLGCFLEPIPDQLVVQDYQLLAIELEAQDHQTCPGEAVVMGTDWAL